MTTIGYSLQVITAPVSLPVSISDAKRQLSLAEAAKQHDPHLTDLIRTATDIVESDANRALITQTLEYQFDHWPYDSGKWVEVCRGPVQSITSVKYIDNDGAEQTWADSNYTEDTNRARGGFYLDFGVSFPQHRAEPNAIRVRYVAGTSVGNVPQIAKQAILLQVAHMFEDREPIPIEMASTYTTLVNRLKFGEYP